MATSRVSVAVCVLAAGGLVAALDLPWYARAPRPTDPEAPALGTLAGPLDASLEALRRLGTERTGLTAWQAVASLDLLLVLLATGAAVAATATLVAELRHLAAAVLRGAALLLAGVVAYLVLDQPGPDAESELRYGAIVALACAGLLVLGAATASAPRRRRGAPGRPVRP